MTQTLLFILGLALYYVVVSPRFRKYLLRCIRSWKGQPLEVTPVAALPASPAVPKVAAAKSAKRYADMNSSGKMVVDQETYEEWLDNIKKASGE